MEGREGGKKERRKEGRKEFFETYANITPSIRLCF